MEIVMIRAFFAWCSVINIVLLTVWVLSFLIARGWMYRMHGKWFNIPEDKFDSIHYSGMAFFKLGIFLFNLVPYFALRIIG